MDKILSEAEAWREIARRIESGGWYGMGLCREVMFLEVTGRIDGATEATMSDRIRAKHREVQGEDNEADYIWAYGASLPRIAACLEFVDEAEAEELLMTRSQA